MPRFDEEAVKVLKQQMVKRLPECYFTQEDVEEMVNKTGLNSAQVLQWAENVRYRIPVQTERESALQEDSTQVT